MILDGPMLKRALKALALPQTYAYPICYAVKLEIVDDDGRRRAHVTASNLDTFHTISNIPVYQGEPGETVVADRKQLLAEIKQCRLVDIRTKEYGDLREVWVCGDDIGGVPLADSFNPVGFPVCTAGELEHVAVVGEPFSEALKSAMRCVDRKSDREILTGIQLEAQADKLLVTSANGYVLYHSVVIGMLKPHPAFTVAADDLRTLPVSSVVNIFVNIFVNETHVRFRYRTAAKRNEPLQGELTIKKLEVNPLPYQPIQESCRDHNQQIQVPLKALKDRKKGDYLVCSADEMEVRMRGSGKHDDDPVVHRYPNNGSYRWIVPDGTLSISEYRLDIEQLNQLSPLATGSSLLLGVTGARTAAAIRNSQGVGVIMPLVRD